MAMLRTVGNRIARSRVNVSARALSSSAGDFHPRFVRENTWEAWDDSSRQRLDFNLDPSVQVVSNEPIADAPNSLRVRFSDGHEGRFDVPSAADQLWGRDLPQWKKKIWGSSQDAASSSDDVSRELRKGGKLRFHHDELVNGESRKQWAEAMQVYGLTLVEGVPVKEGAVINFGNEAFGYVSPSAYGYKFTVKSVENPNNLAYSDKGIQQHTDLPFYSTPPSIQLFHCLAKAPEGGESFFMDGLDTAASLWKQNKKMFDLLCEHKVRFQDVTGTWHLSAKHPTFLMAENQDMDGFPDIKRICFNERTRDSWRDWLPANDAEMAKMHEFYEALTAYETLVEQRERYSRILLEPGEMIATDNWRVLHSRGSFKGARHLEGAYLDWDAVFAAWRASGTEFSMQPAPDAY